MRKTSTAAAGQAAKAMLASKQLPQEPSAKFPLPAPKAAQGKVSWRENAPDPEGSLPAGKPASQSKPIEPRRSMGAGRAQ